MKLSTLVKVATSIFIVGVSSSPIPAEEGADIAVEGLKKVREAAPTEEDIDIVWGLKKAHPAFNALEPDRSIGDIQPSDLRIVGDWLCRHVPPGMKDYQIQYSFQSFSREIGILEELHHAEKSDAPNSSAVRMHCEGGTEILKSPKYESLEISTADCIFLHRNTNCTKALDIALVLLPFKESYDYQNFEAQHGLALRTNSSVPHRNEDALFLFLTINPEDESWGGRLSPREMKSITGNQVEAIANYFRRVVYFKMGNLIHKHKDGRPPTFEKEKVTKNLLNRDTFDKYLGEFKKAKIESGDYSWSDTISPFDV